jgi:hypothetical protein
MSPARPAPGRADAPARSRIGRARETARTVKVAVTVAAAGAFAAVVALAQAAHPGSGATSSETAGGGTLSPPASFQERLSEDGFFGRGDVGPSTQGSAVAPQARTHTS